MNLSLTDQEAVAVLATLGARVEEIIRQRDRETDETWRDQLAGMGNTLAGVTERLRQEMRESGTRRIRADEWSGA